MPMDRPDIPLNALRTFEVAARQGSFTNAAIELRVTQAAVSHQILRLEDLLGFRLFHRKRDGLSLTSEAEVLVPLLSKSFDRIGGLLDRIQDGQHKETLNVGVVTTFALGWLLPRMTEFEQQYPGIKIRTFTNNNRVDITKKGLDSAIRFGDGRWHGLVAEPLLSTPLTPLCAPSVAAHLRSPACLHKQLLLRSYRSDEWTRWFEECGHTPPTIDGPVFDSSIAMANLAEAGQGVAMLAPKMFRAQLSLGSLVQPFEEEITTGRYWFTWSPAKDENPALRLFGDWLQTTD